MSRRTVTIIAFAVAVILTILGCNYCKYKILPLIRLALWFPLPYLLGANELLGVILAFLQFPLLACVFVLATRRWRVGWVFASFVVVYALYAGVVIAIHGPPR